MGKTLQMIALFSYQKIFSQGKFPILIIVPVSAIYQWKSELEYYTIKDTFSILIYHGIIYLKH